MPDIINATEARKRFFKLLRKVGVPGHVVTITLNDSPPVIMMAAEEYEGWLEKMDILSDPEEAKEILKRKRELDEGTVKAIPWENVKAELDS